jgi:magnesium-transporting ATPase (P-type)
VVYTRPNTKVVRNSMTLPYKRSWVETRLDKVIYVLFLMLIIISLITSIGSSRYTTKTAKGHWYLLLCSSCWCLLHTFICRFHFELKKSNQPRQETYSSATLQNRKIRPYSSVVINDILFRDLLNSNRFNTSYFLKLTNESFFLLICNLIRY